jgi:hypothetical protein
LFQDKPYTKWLKSIDERCVIVYVQDPLREVRYYHLTGADIETYAALIRQRVPVHDRGEIEAMMASARSSTKKVVAIYHAAVSAPPVRDPAVFDFLTRSLTDPEPDVRRAAVDAVLLVLWPDLQEPLERVATADKDADLRAFAEETLQTLQTQVWNVALGKFDFVPLPPNPKRIIPLTGVGDDWYKHAHGERPKLQSSVANTPSRKKKFGPPDWLVGLMQKGNWADIRWHTPEQIQKATVSLPAADSLSLSKEEEFREEDEELLSRMVSVGEGPEREDRTERKLRARLYIDRKKPRRLLVALAENHLPSLWVPAGNTRKSVEAVLAAYCFPGLPKQQMLPFQGRLFLTTMKMPGDDFKAIENHLSQSEFCDSLVWGSSHRTDPYPERVTLGSIPPRDLRRYLAQAPGARLRTSVRTRFSRSIIQAIDFDNSYFVDLYFRPAPPEYADEYNARYGTQLPAGTPVDIVASLSGFTLFGPEPIRKQMEESEDENERNGLKSIIDFLKRAPAD